MGIDCWMVTGDNITTAEAIAERLDIPKDRILASAMPTAKVFKVQELQSAGNFVAMIGDGINDSPALAKADLGNRSLYYWCDFQDSYPSYIYLFRNSNWCWYTCCY